MPENTHGEEIGSPDAKATWMHRDGRQKFPTFFSLKFKPARSSCFHGSPSWNPASLTAMSMILILVEQSKVPSHYF